MADFRIPYGEGTLGFQLPDTYEVIVLGPANVPAAPDPVLAVEQALDGVNWNAWHGAERVAIAVNDKTRPVPHQHLLPPLLRRLERLGLRPEDITLLIATGTHRVMSPAEYPSILPVEVIERYPIDCHDSTDQAGLVYLGETRRGTPLWLNRRFAHADVRIVVGNVEPHQIMGFSGGVKSAAIGLAGRATINQNHALMAQPGAELGHYHGNPARQDLEEMGQLAGVHLALNVVLNGNKQIVYALAGEPLAVMETAIPLVRAVYQVPVESPFDLMIVSPGGHPKDINVYQAQKALGHAALASQPGGTIIVAAACIEGAGSAGYQSWVATTESHEAVLDRFRREGFRIGPHKAFQIARDSISRRVLWVSEMSPELMSRLLLDRADSLVEALDLALADLPAGARIAVMPLANATIPSRGQAPT